MKICTQIFLGLIFALITAVCSTSVEKDLTLTRSEKNALDEFGKRVRAKLPHNWQKQDIYLIRWLRARNFDLVEAERMLMDNLKWREENKIDGILKEDFSDVENDFKIFMDGFDKEGKPVAYLNFGDWNVRKAALSGTLHRNLHYLDKFLEEITTKIRQLQKEGENITQYNFIMNLRGFSLIEHACAQCLPSYLSFISSYENHYPGAADNMILINTPRIFEIVLNAARIAMSQTTRNALKIYGTNRLDWQPKLFYIISRDQLPKEVGGTRIYKDDD